MVLFYRRVGLIAAFLVPLGCGKADDGGPSGPPVQSQEEAAEGFRAVSTVLASLGSAIPSGAELGDDKDIRFRDTDIDIDVDLACPEGGTVGIDGTFTQLGDGYDPNDPSGGVSLDISFSYSMDFDGCTSLGVVIDGSLDYSADMTADSTTGSYSYSFDYSGAIEFSGAVSGVCEIDASGAADSSNPSAITLEGTICGFEASEIQI